MKPFFSKPFTTCCGNFFRIAALSAAFAGSAMPALADEVKVVDASIEAVAENRYRISVTLLHADEGWKHYANRWLVLDEQGNELGTRTLMHPHVNEQPFTRSLTIDIPANVKVITIVGGDLVHDDSEHTLKVAVPDRK